MTTRPADGPAFADAPTIMTREVCRMRRRGPDRAAERSAAMALAGALRSGREGVLRRLAEVAGKLCLADFAGVGRLETLQGDPAIRWRAAAGPQAAQRDGVWPLGQGPWASTLEHQVLVRCPAQLLPEAAVSEALVTPLPLSGAPMTLWVLCTAKDRGFDAEDARVTAALANYVGGLLEIDTAYRALYARLERRESMHAAEVRALANELSRIEQAERARVAQILHDGLQQQLVSAKFQVSLARRQVPPAARRTMVAAETLIDESIETTRSLSVELRPPVLESQGLGAGLQWLAERLRDRHGFIVGVEISGSDAIESADIRAFVFEAVRELLFNCVKHAGVDHATVRMQRSPEGLRILVEDCGKGFDPSALVPAARSDGGIGLPSVRRRLALLGGTLELDSVPGRGTLATLTVPVDAVRPSAPSYDSVAAHPRIRRRRDRRSGSPAPTSSPPPVQASA